MVQSECLASGGFSVSDKLEVKTANLQIILKPANKKEGRYTVSKRSRSVTARELAELFDGLENSCCHMISTPAIWRGFLFVGILTRHLC